MDVLKAFRSAMQQAGVPNEYRAHLVGYFCNEWNKQVGLSENVVKEGFIIVNDEGIELPIEMREDGKWQFCAVTQDGQRPCINATLPELRAKMSSALDNLFNSEYGIARKNISEALDIVDRLSDSDKT